MAKKCKKKHQPPQLQYQKYNFTAGGRPALRHFEMVQPTAAIEPPRPTVEDANDPEPQQGEQLFLRHPKNETAALLKACEHITKFNFS